MVVETKGNTLKRKIMVMRIADAMRKMAMCHPPASKDDAVTHTARPISQPRSKLVRWWWRSAYHKSHNATLTITLLPQHNIPQCNISQKPQWNILQPRSKLVRWWWRSAYHKSHKQMPWVLTAKMAMCRPPASKDDVTAHTTRSISQPRPKLVR